MSVRGGPQVIPRPADARPGRPAPWISLGANERVVTLDLLRSTFTGRIGAASAVEGKEGVHGSAVLACFWEHEGAVEVLLTRRAGHLRAHQGELSFPGGRRDEGESLVEAALREAREEVALDTSSVEVLGELDHLMTITSGAFIVPFVATVPARPELAANPSEVDAVLFVPVAELLLPEIYREELWSWSGDVVRERSIFFFELVGDTLWGATAAMIRQLLGLCLGLDTAIDHV